MVLEGLSRATEEMRNEGQKDHQGRNKAVLICTSLNYLHGKSKKKVYQMKTLSELSIDKLIALQT